MSLHRRAAKRDTVEPLIVSVLKRAGATVDHLSGEGTPDLLVGFKGRTHLMECKGRGAKLTPAQEDWHGRWQGEPVAVVHDPSEALAVLLAPARQTGRALPEIEP